tara:strand:+ start:87 stop:500 length:414 start_codon:yes stop_codon:yes gene_type:complete
MAIVVSVTSFENISEIGSITPVVVGRSDFNSQLELDMECTFFNAEGIFTEPVRYEHITGEIDIYMGLLNNPHVDFSIVLKNKQSDRRMQLRLQESKILRQPAEGDIATIRGVKYTVNDVQPDGVGTTTLAMQRTYNV